MAKKILEEVVTRESFVNPVSLVQRYWKIKRLGTQGDVI